MKRLILMIFTRFFKRFSLAVTILFASFTLVKSQSFDYKKTPVLNYDFLEADINLQLNPSEATVNGSVVYRLEANITGADTLVLNAVGIRVDSVAAGNKPVNYSTSNGRLFIALTDSSIMGQQYRVKIYYYANPRFGLLKDSEKTVWTSMLPKSTRHWLPVIDHPRVELITTLSLTVPTRYTVAASGVKTEETKVDSTRKTVTFRSAKPIPVTSLAFAAGSFKKEGTSYGIKRIISYAESHTISIDKQRMLTDKARQIITEIEEAAGLKYPWQRVHIVVLGDHFWEQKPYGASVIYLYQNRGNLINQLRRGLYAQWFGVYQFETQWDKSWHIQFLQSVLHYEIADQPALLNKQDTPETAFSTVYNNFSVKSWNYWQHYFEQANLNTHSIARQTISELLQNGSATLTLERYEDVWYSISGQPSIDASAFNAVNDVPNGSTAPILYRVDYHLMNDSLKLVFTALKNPVTQPRTIPLKIISSDTETVKEILFSGASDSLIIILPPQTQNIRFGGTRNENLYLEVHKPVSFILFQLRNADDVQVRKRAALQLGYHTNNPDLQLALTNYLNREMQPEVKAALLRSYAAIIDGATGTQQYFLDALSSSSAMVRKAALEALENYPEDERITQKLQAIIKNNSRPELAAQALGIYMQRIDSTSLLEYTNTLIRQDTAGTKAIAAIAGLAELGQTKAAVQRAKYYIRPVYSFSVRQQALSILLKYDNSAERWSKRIKMLLTDLDPRIRYLTVQNLASIPGVKPQAVLQKYIPEAYDVRVYQAIHDT